MIEWRLPKERHRSASWRFCCQQCEWVGRWVNQNRGPKADNKAAHKQYQLHRSQHQGGTHAA